MWISACRQKQPTLRQLLGQDEVNSCVATRSSDLEAFEIFEVTRKPPTSADSSLLCGESRTCRLRPSVLISYRNAQKSCGMYLSLKARSGTRHFPLTQLSHVLGVQQEMGLSLTRKKRRFQELPGQAFVHGCVTFGLPRCKRL